MKRIVLLLLLAGGAAWVAKQVGPDVKRYF